MLLYRVQQLLLGERLGQILLGTDDTSPGPVEQTILTRKHDDVRVTEILFLIYDFLQKL